MRKQNYVKNLCNRTDLSYHIYFNTNLRFVSSFRLRSCTKKILSRGIRYLHVCTRMTQIIMRGMLLKDLRFLWPKSALSHYYCNCLSPSHPGTAVVPHNSIVDFSLTAYNSCRRALKMFITIVRLGSEPASFGEIHRRFHRFLSWTSSQNLTSAKEKHY